MKWIELLSAVGEHKAGQFLEVEDNIARSYIDGGLARDGGDGPEVVLLQRSMAAFRAELKGITESTAEVIRTTTEQLRAGVRDIRIDSVPGGDEADKTKGCGDFLRCVVRASDPRDLESMRDASERLAKVYKVQRGMAEGSGAAGGYTTPVLYESMILSVAAEDAAYIAGATEVPLGARQVEYPALNQFSAPAAGQSAMFGGVQVKRKGETAQRSESHPGFDKVVLMATDLTGYAEFSRDLLEDSTATLDALVPRLIGQAIGWRIDWEALQGSGVGQFLGILNSPATITVSRTTGSHVKYADVVSMYGKLLPTSQRRARWVVHPFVLPELMQMQDGSSRNIWLPNVPGSSAGPVAFEPAGTLLGRPIFCSEKAPALGTVGDITLFDPAMYLHGKRSGLEIGISEHFKFDTDQIAIRAKVRNDGKPWLKAPIYLADGSGTNQVTSFVTLT